MNRLGLRLKIFSILIALVFITIGGGVVMMWHTYNMEGLLKFIIDKELEAYQTAEALESSLENQKGFVSYYILDGDPVWLEKLDKYLRSFNQQLETARKLAEPGPGKEIIKRIDKEYKLYSIIKNDVIEYYKAGERKAGARIHEDVRQKFFKILNLCEEFKNYHIKKVRQAKKQSLSYAQKLRSIALAAMLAGLMLGLLLIFILTTHVLGPIQRMAAEANRQEDGERPANEVKALGRNIRGLIEDIDQTSMELEHSREHLLQAEKMVMVGKLAAGMAHSIRNPLTSVKMRLFSLSRTLEMSDIQKEDFQVISEEIRHIDTIVQNFLEFSRPPRLNMQCINPSIVVDQTIQLLEHRLNAYNVNIKFIRNRPLSEIYADPDQLKEALVNIIVNACEAMEKKGRITIQEKEVFLQPFGRAVAIRLTDNGPGIPESVKTRLFQPFFTTKEEGSGLGLSIALRIIEEHGGTLDADSAEGEGAVFIITIPVK